MKRVLCLYLDILSIPGMFMGKEGNALFHLRHVCPRCPGFRRRMRYCGGDECWWHLRWKAGEYNIPRHFGLASWIRQYLFLRTGLERDHKKSSITRTTSRNSKPQKNRVTLVS